jgi:lipoprotein-releasing system ATP-binding protein
MNDSVIRAIDLHKVYHQGGARIEALRDMDVEIGRGQSVLIVGPSGAGKSTLLHIIGGLLAPTIGKVYFRNTDLYRLSDTERARVRNMRIGFVFQFYHLLSEFTALENVMLPALIRGVRPHQKAKRLLDMVGLSHRMRHRPRELSGGEAQRVAIARALINDPDVVLCDEPTGNLDSEMGHMIYKILWRISKEENKTIVVVTHSEVMREDFDAAYYISDGMIQKKEQLWV